jgi:hypothetical protein
MLTTAPRRAGTGVISYKKSPHNARPPSASHMKVVPKPALSFLENAGCRMLWSPCGYGISPEKLSYFLSNVENSLTKISPASPPVLPNGKPNQPTFSDFLFILRNGSWSKRRQKRKRVRTNEAERVYQDEGEEGRVTSSSSPRLEAGSVQAARASDSPSPLVSPASPNWRSHNTQGT